MSENKFTPRAEEALRLSQEAAEELGHGYVGSEHLLLGLIREEDGVAHRVLSEFGVTDEMVCSVLQRSVGKGVSGAAPSQGLTPRAKSVVELAVSEAARMGSSAIGTAHLLMGILREGGNMGLRILRTVGVDPNKMYSAVVKRVGDLSRTVPAGTQLRLTPGMSISIQPRLYHDFEVEPGSGDVLIGEVSQCNDDNTDNRFEPPVGRFPAIEEDEPPYRLLCNEYPEARS